MTSELEKAQKFVLDKNHNLNVVASKIGISISAIKKYRYNPVRLRKASWLTVHKLAKELDKREVEK